MKNKLQKKHALPILALLVLLGALLVSFDKVGNNNTVLDLGEKSADSSTSLFSLLGSDRSERTRLTDGEKVIDMGTDDFIHNVLSVAAPTDNIELAGEIRMKHLWDFQNTVGVVKYYREIDTGEILASTNLEQDLLAPSGLTMVSTGFFATGDEYGAYPLRNEFPPITPAMAFEMAQKKFEGVSNLTYVDPDLYYIKIGGPSYLIYGDKMNVVVTAVDGQIVSEQGLKRQIEGLYGTPE